VLEVSSEALAVIVLVSDAVTTNGIEIVELDSVEVDSTEDDVGLGNVYEYE